MKTALLFVLILTASSSFAEEGGFEKRKQEMTAHLEARIQALTTAKSCVASAQDHEALKSCKAALREDRLEMQEERLENRKNRMEGHMLKLQEQKAKMRDIQKGK